MGWVEAKAVLFGEDEESEVSEGEAAAKVEEDVEEDNGALLPDEAARERLIEGDVEDALTPKPNLLRAASEGDVSFALCSRLDVPGCVDVPV